MTEAMMRVIREPDNGDWQKQIASATLGAVGGLVIGTVLSRVLHRASGRAARDLRVRPAERFQPAPMQRPRVDQPELDRLETAVLGEFLMDTQLRDRSIEIGAISGGIIELSGTVMSVEEVRRAVEIASRVEGVETVVNRMDVERPYRATNLRSTSPAGGALEHNEGRVGGMGRRRQGGDTEPLQRDDSQPMRRAALSAADRDQLADEGFAGPAASTRRRVDNATNFEEDELDNQDPHGKHARFTLDRPREELNSFARVGEKRPAGADLRLERADTTASGGATRTGDDRTGDLKT
jgi:hypothetical protein